MKSEFYSDSATRTLKSKEDDTGIDLTHDSKR